MIASLIGGFAGPRWGVPLPRLIDPGDRRWLARFMSARLELSGFVAILARRAIAAAAPAAIVPMSVMATALVTPRGVLVGHGFGTGG